MKTKAISTNNDEILSLCLGQHAGKLNTHNFKVELLWLHFRGNKAVIRYVQEHRTDNRVLKSNFSMSHFRILAITISTVKRIKNTTDGPT